jgi:hypothetical protein
MLHSAAAGIIISPPTAAGQLRVARLTDRLQLAAARHVEALRSLAAGYWRYMRHPGWALAPDALVRTHGFLCLFCGGGLVGLLVTRGVLLQR